MIDFPIDENSPPILMGVVNVTPDSFSDGGSFLDTDRAIAHALQLEREGAAILDIGGESTRPGAKPISLEEEQNRVLPVIEGLKKAGCKAAISIDTRNAETMQKAINIGADIINDISSLTYDSESLDVVAKAQMPVILMHMQGSPETMQDNPLYDDVVQEIFDYLNVQIERCLRAGLPREKIICDPGIGFGKTLEDNLTILKNMDKFHHLDCTVLLGASRKSFIEKLCPDTPPTERLAGSIAAAIRGLEQGVQIFRVHDVKQTRQAFEVWQSTRSI
ncbi:MAG TPA: dihydropteroate synthase [Alphaproteobacteria bacterium]|nr:dihydropteroate synthase [Alphaproteobacteria bacterium]